MGSLRLFWYVFAMVNSLLSAWAAYLDLSLWIVGSHLAIAAVSYFLWMKDE